MGEHVEVCTIELPGRGLRAQEVPLGRVDEIVSHVVPALRHRLDVPFAFFGIDLGAILMFETTRQLRAEGAPVPDHLFVAAAMAPQTYYFAPTHYLPRQRFLRGFRNVGVVVDESLAAERPLRADAAAMSSYVFAQEPPLDIPITNFWGQRDYISPPESNKAWRVQTAAPFTFHVWPGSHDLLCDEAHAVIDTVRDVLAGTPFYPHASAATSTNGPLPTAGSDQSHQDQRTPESRRATE
jgi:medium-chain acyl-[acyl-carrier-protein] hydrolase